jgi:hypothetical protein
VPRSSRNQPRGQVLVLFVLALLVIVAAVGLIIDGGFAYGQRRAEQNAADFAALAGSDALLNGKNANAAALAAAAQNGYTHGTGGVTVTVTTTSKTVQVDVSAPHSNYFLGALGQPTWQVSVTATALAGVGTKFLGVAPFILSQDVFDPATGLPYQQYADPNNPVDFTKTTGSGSDSPLTLTNLAWTNLGTGSVSSKDIKAAMDGSAPINAELRLNQYIGQANNGVKNDAFDTNSPNQPSVNTTLAGQDVILPIVGPPSVGTNCVDGTGAPDSHTIGCFRGWALFHVVSATKRGGGDDGTITGYFVSGITRSASVEDVCAITDTACLGTFHGTYVVKLIN